MNLTYPLFAKTNIQPQVDMLKGLLRQYITYVDTVLYYHWNVKGDEFFDVHEQFETLYKTGIDHIDDIAERIVSFNEIATPYTRAKADVQDEAASTATPVAMVQHVLTLMTDLILVYRTGIHDAMEQQDYGTAHIMMNQLAFLEQKRWMLDSFQAKKA